MESILPLLSDPLIPTPDYLVADVGATILETNSMRPIGSLQWEIEERWIGPEPIMAALDDLDGLVRQFVPQERRCSFFSEDPGIDDEVRQRLAGLPVDVLRSARRYLDVLPKGVSKGSSLRRLVEHLGVDPATVLVAGDTMNDLSLYETGYPGVVVGAAEPALVEATQGMPTVFHAARAGAGGILEALARTPAWSPMEVATPPNPGDAQLVMVYHRLPFEERLVDGAVQRQPHSSPNGIIPTLLGCFEGGRHGSWVAWSVHGGAGRPAPAHDLVDEERFPNLIAARVPLDESDVDRFYKRFSKEAFWPVIFSFVDRAEFSSEDWAHFVSINQRFAERTAAEADAGATVWIHDYNLWMVPAFLRQLRPDLRIAFFHHTSFPPADVFNVIPWAGQIIGSLAQCDYIGFHIPRYVANFVDVLQSHLPVDILATEPCAPRFRIHGVALALTEMPVAVQVGERRIGLGAHPVGVNVRSIRQLLGTQPVLRQMAEVRERFKGERLILSVERLDYVKGPLQKLEAFEALLERHPEFRGTATLLFVTTPPAPGMEIYEATRVAVDQAVGRISGRFGTLEWTPVHYLFRALPFEEVLALSAAADIAWITPLRDGLNLVAKEYVMAQEAVGGNGVLLLSEFAGASVELHGALLTNPYDLESLREGLHEALHLPEEDRRHRIRRLARVVEGYDVDDWSREFLRAVEAMPAGEPRGSLAPRP